MSGLLIFDKSAYARGFRASDYEAEVCSCDITELEILYSARSRDEYVRLEGDLAGFRRLRMDAQTMAAARGAQRELAERGRHRLPIPDILIAACAAQHGAGVLHADRHYDALADVLDFEPVRLR